MPTQGHPTHFLKQIGKSAIDYSLVPLAPLSQHTKSAFPSELIWGRRRQCGLTFCHRHLFKTSVASLISRSVSVHIWLFLTFDLWSRCEQLFKDNISNFLPNTLILSRERFQKQALKTFYCQSKKYLKSVQKSWWLYIALLQTIWGCWRWIWGVKYEMLNMKWSVKYEVLNACRPSAGMSLPPLLSLLTFFVDG